MSQESSRTATEIIEMKQTQTVLYEALYSHFITLMYNTKWNGNQTETYLSSKIPGHEGHFGFLARGILPVPEVHTHGSQGAVVVPYFHLLEPGHLALLGEVHQQRSLPLVSCAHYHQLDATIRLRSEKGVCV